MTEAAAAPDGLPPLREVSRRHGLGAKKSLGQNFLLDLNLAGRIARAAGPLSGATVYEVGPGPGGLTRALLAHDAARVVAVERDDRAMAALQEVATRYPGRLDIVAADALTFDPRPCLPNGPVRIVAEPHSKIYGRLSVLVQWRCEARILFDVNASAFVPPPSVTSSLVRLVPRPAPLACDRALLESVTQAAFGQRRKMLRQSLRSLGANVNALLAAANIDPTARAEDLSVADFVALARALAAIRKLGHDGGPETD